MCSGSGGLSSYSIGSLYWHQIHQLDAPVGLPQRAHLYGVNCFNYYQYKYLDMITWYLQRCRQSYEDNIQVYVPTLLSLPQKRGSLEGLLQEAWSSIATSLCTQPRASHLPIVGDTHQIPFVSGEYHHQKSDLDVFEKRSINRAL